MVAVEIVLLVRPQRLQLFVCHCEERKYSGNIVDSVCDTREGKLAEQTVILLSV
jgi:hypothetical protein